MSYLSQDDPSILDDIARRKEFYQFQIPPRAATVREDWQTDVYRDSEETDLYIDPQSYQSIVSNFMSPNTPYSRILLKWEPGMGKTIAAIEIAMQYVRIFSREDQNNHVGSIFIIGFTEEIFKQELLSSPKYGFVSRDELAQLENLRRQADTTGAAIDAEMYVDFTIRLKKRLTNRQQNGFFKFFGYKAFVNRIFQLGDFKRNINELSEDEIRQALQDGSLKWDRDLLESFRNSLVICDEIHNVYNSVEKNNWGVALQMVFDRHPSLKVVLMSATPLNNSPTEIVDLVNLLVPPEQKITKAEIFSDRELKPGSLQRIARAVRGRVSFVQDSNPKYFADMTIEGETIPKLDYLRFYRNPMTPFHYKTYKEVYRGVLAQDAQYLVDIAFPNPGGEIGLYRTNDIKRAFSFVDEKWYKKYGFRMNEDAIVGHGFHEENIKQWSCKMYNLLQHIKRLLAPDEGKIFVYHNVVHISGVIFIEQLLQSNGFISYEQNSTSNTLCALCGMPRSAHTPEQINGTLTEGGSASTLTEGGSASTLTERGTWSRIHSTAEKQEYAERERVWYGWKSSRNLESSNIISHGNTFIDYTENSNDVTIISILPVREEDTPALPEWSNKPVSFTLHESNPHREEIQKFIIKHGFKKHDAGCGYTVWVLERHIKGGKQETKKDNHPYRPAKYLVVHSDMEKSNLGKNIERYNLPENYNGYECKILIGSKIIKESYNLKAVQHAFIVGRPDNIPTLIQILGRARRKRSHIMLPPERRHIHVYIYTSCSPERDRSGRYIMSHEEQKYMEKIEDYKIIQRIERVFVENAIDGALVRDIVTPGLSRKPELGALWYEPVQRTRRYRLSDLTLDTFGVFHSDREIKEMIYIIKRLFIEQSRCYTFDKLLEAVRAPPFETEINTSLFEVEYFAIALNLIVYFSNDSFIQPPDIETRDVYTLDILRNSVDKRIVLPDRTVCYIHYYERWYVLIPHKQGEPLKFPESPFRSFAYTPNRPINVLKYIKETSNVLNYEKHKLKFKAKYEEVDLENLAPSLGQFGIEFHKIFIEEAIRYVFELWTVPSITVKSEMHDFYFKMLYFYDLLGLVVWAYRAKEFIREMYKDFLLSHVVQRVDINVENTSQSLTKASRDLAVRLSKSALNTTIKRSYELLQLRAKLNSEKKKLYDRLVKADPYILPIGHFMARTPRFFHPEREWFDSPEYVQQMEEYRENDIIVGYYEKDGGLNVKFKIRRPIHMIERHHDIRMIEKGSMCSTHTKEELFDIARRLGIKIPDKINVPNICKEIEHKLLQNELEERRKKTNIKWFYSFWETRPDERRGMTSTSQ